MSARDTLELPGIDVSQAAGVHPHAAAPCADFILSQEGREIVRERNRVPVSLAVDSPSNKFGCRLVGPAIALDEWDRWSTLRSDLFPGGKEAK